MVGSLTRRPGPPLMEKRKWWQVPLRRGTFSLRGAGEMSSPISQLRLTLVWLGQEQEVEQRIVARVT